MKEAWYKATVSLQKIILHAGLGSILSISSPKRFSYRRLNACVLVHLLMIFLAVASPSAAFSDEPEERPQNETSAEECSDSEEKWGIKIVGIRLTANNYMLDFRYRVIDPEKAHMFTQKQIKPYLIDQATGNKLAVTTTRLGPMRQTAVKPVSGRNYAILFGNTNKVVKAGSKVTVVIGDFKVENLVVE